MSYVGTTLAHNQVSVATTATVISPADNDQRKVAIRNLDASATIYLGGSGVTTSNGFPLKPDEVYEIETAAAIYGIVASGTANAAYFSTQN